MRPASGFACLVLAFLFGGCAKESATGNVEPTSAQITVQIGGVGSLAKRADIEYSRLLVTLSSTGETVRRDTFALSGNGMATVTKTYANLAAGKTWSLSAYSLDREDSLIHAGSTSFIPVAGRTTDVNLYLDTRFAMLKLAIFPIVDSLTRCQLLIDSIVRGDTTFPKQSLVGDTVRMEFDYLRTGHHVRLQLHAYGDSNGVNRLMYRADTVVFVPIGSNGSIRIMLRRSSFTGPSEGGIAAWISLGRVWTVTVDGVLEGGERTPGEGWKEMGKAMTQLTDIWFINRGLGWASGPGGQISRTSDGGRIWESQNTGTTNWINALHFTDSLHGWAVGSNSEILSTRDGGANWVKVANPGGAWYSDVFFLDTLQGWVVGSVNQGNGEAIVLLTKDGGRTWTSQVAANAFSIHKVWFADAQTGYLAGHYYARTPAPFFRTSNGGETWIRDSVDIGWVRAMNFIHPDTGWVAGDSHGQNQGLVARTVDGGRHWTVHDVPGTTHVSALGFVDGTNGWALGNHAYKTVDGGMTWQPEFFSDGWGFTAFHNLDRQSGWAGGTYGKIYLRPSLPLEP